MPFFSAAVARIRRRENEWILESSKFDDCMFGEELHREANLLLRDIKIIVALYLRWHGATLYISSILNLNSDDRIVQRTVFGYPLTVNILKRFDDCFKYSKSGSNATDMILLATRDPEVREAMSLIGDEDIRWSRVYDIIEFLGGERGVAKLCPASGARVRHVRQTANHHRHLGSPKQSPLPPKPLSLHEASEFVIDLLKQWISSRMT
jgi:hypothetical protein